MGQILLGLPSLSSRPVGTCMIHGFDASVCPDTDTLRILHDSSVFVGGGYIGGATPHVWTAKEWSRLELAGIHPLPIWVAPFESKFHELGAIAGNAALERMQAFGLTSLLVLDIEAGFGIAEDWVLGFSDAVVAGDCALALYGATEDIRRLSPSANPLFNWVSRPSAAWTFLLPDTSAWQYWFGPDYDLSVMDNDIPVAQFV